MVTITFLPDEINVTVTPEDTILQASLRAGIPHAHACGGNARCSTCRVWVLSGVEHLCERNPAEQRIAGPLHFSPQLRLACQTRVVGEGPVVLKLRRLVLDTDDMEVAAEQAGTLDGSVGEERLVTVLFSDIRGFTALAEALPPYDVIFLLNRYFHRVGQIIQQHGGYIDNYMGDGFMALFGMETGANEAVSAVQAGLEMLEAVQELNPFVQANYGRQLEIGVGLHCGTVVVGSVGVGDRRRTTAIGDAVNLASRVESANKQFGTHLLVSETTYQRVRDAVIFGGTHETEIKGKSGKYRLTEVVGLRDAAVAQFEQAVQAVAVEAVLPHIDGRRWVRALDAQALAEGERRVVKALGQSVLVVRHDGRLFAMESACPHLQLPLKGGRMERSGDGAYALTCPWHHSCFELPGGEVRDWAPWPPGVGPMLGKMSKERALVEHPVAVHDGGIWVALAG